MKFKHIILSSLMAGVVLFSLGVPLARAQDTLVSPAAASAEPSPEPVMGPVEPTASEEANATLITATSPSIEPSASPEASASAQVESSVQPTATPEPTLSPAASVAPTSSYVAPQQNTGFFSWKGFFNLDSFFDKFWGTRFQSSLDGKQEVGSYGDPDGAGKVMLETYPSGSKMCVVLKTTGLDQLTGVSIHWGPFGQAHESAADFPMIIADGVGSGCMVVDSELLKDIRKNPFNYYVNVTTMSYPDGAIRGQLSRQ